MKFPKLIEGQRLVRLRYYPQVWPSKKVLPGNKLVKSSVYLDGMGGKLAQHGGDFGRRVTARLAVASAEGHLARPSDNPRGL